MEANDASRIIAVVDRRITKHTGSEAQTETTWGEVCGVSADGKYASAYLYGETDVPSQDFRVPGSLAVSVGDKVKVAWNARGERWVYDVALASDFKKVAIDPNAGTIKVGDGTVAPALLIADSSGVVVGVHDHDADYADIAHTDHTRLRATATDDVSPTTTLHPFQVGPDGGNNIAMDPNEIMARDNGLAADLHLNADGGLVTINNNSAGGTLNGLKVMRGGIRIGTSSIPTETTDLSLMIGADIELYRAAADQLRTKAGDTLYGSAVARWLTKTSTLAVANITYVAVSAWSTTPFVGAGVTYDGSDELVVDRDGLYLFFCRSAWSTSSAGIRLFGIDINNTSNVAPDASHQVRWPVSTDTNDEIVQGWFLASLSASDRVCLKVWQNSGGSLNMTGATIAGIMLGHGV